MPRRPALTRQLVLDAAVRVADGGGLGAVSMRNVASELGVEAMSLYHHIAGKEALLDDLANWIFTQIELPAASTPWRRAMRERATSARHALAAHPWALGLGESRHNPGEALLAHHEAVLANLRAHGFSVALATHAFSAIDAYVYGFVLTELSLPFAEGENAEQFAAGIQHLLPPDRYPNMTAMLTEQVIGKDYDYANEFEFGLDLILDGVERHRRAARATRTRRASS